MRSHAPVRWAIEVGPNPLAEIGRTDQAVTTSSTNMTGTPGARSKAGAAASGKLHPVVWVYLLSVIIPLGFDLGSVAMTGLRLVLLFTIIPTTAGLFSGKYGKVYPVDYLFCLHMLWATLAMFMNNPGIALQNSGSFILEFLGGYMLGRAYIRTPADFAALVRALLLLVAASLPFAIYEALHGTAPIPAWIAKLPGFNSVNQLLIEKRMGLFRVQVYFAHPIHYGLFCSSVLAVYFVGLRGIASNGARFGAAAVIGTGVFLSLSSGALLSALLQVSLIFWAYIFRNNPARWKILIGMFVFIYIAIDLGSNRTPIRVMMSYATFSAHNAFYRSIIFEWGMINVWNNPIFGLGLRSWIRPHYMVSGSMDNFWLVMAVRYGIPGFLLIAAGYADALFRVGRRKLVERTTLSNMRLAWMISFLGLSFTLVTVHIWTAVYSYVFFLLGAGLWMATYEEQAGGDEGVPSGARPEREGPRYSRAGAGGLVHAREAALVAGAAGGEAGGKAAGADLAPSGRDEGEPAREGPSFSRFPDREAQERAGRPAPFTRRDP